MRRIQAKHRVKGNKRLVRSHHTREVLHHFQNKAVKQDDFGFKKYGKYLDPMDGYDWLNMAEEEAVDMFKYFHAERIRRDVILADILDIQKRLEENLQLYRGISSVDVSVWFEMESDLKAIREDVLRLSKNLEGKTGQTTEDKEEIH